MKNKVKIFSLALLIVLSFGVISFAKQPSITAQNNISITEQKHYPVIDITNHLDKHIMVEWGAYGDAYQGDILVPPNTTVSLSLPQLSFLGQNHETTTVWLTWQDDDFLKPRGTDVITNVFDVPKVPSTNPPSELGMK